MADAECANALQPMICEASEKMKVTSFCGGTSVQKYEGRGGIQKKTEQSRVGIVYSFFPEK